MNYQKVYNNLVSKGQLRNKKRGMEKHHILPRALGGDDSLENIVYLTLREHFIAHLLLAKITRHPAMIYAFNMMKNRSGKYKVNSKLFSSLMSEFREEHRLAMRKFMLDNENPMKNPEIAAKISGDNHYMRKPGTIKDCRKGSNNPVYGRRNLRKYQLFTPYGVFSSITEAAKALKIDPNTVYRRLKQETELWYKITDEN
jgi:hypothetical protein